MSDRNDDLGAGLIWHEGDMPYSPRFDDHYYTTSDGAAETRYVFLDGNGLPARWRDVERFRIGELGFGTGLNFIETAALWHDTRRAGQSLEFVSFERYPLAADQIERALAVWPGRRPLVEKLVADWPSPDAMQAVITITLDEGTTLRVVIGDVANCIDTIAAPVDAWYLDGFAPSRNPDMWGGELMRTLARKSRTGTTLATYSAAGWVRRNLEAAGFSVLKRPGHAGKRQMLTGYLP
ncbi:tRNA (5-methylaminomethyl-2-thiouridine)(34)-methyltransferase MnmD [Pararhizobium haloflavum]|uniref:tRNA (5-methylaminomethyl-2-thiouridine)(34)-methyltransferase MnmD n=1 Tax=Pararhizobium haloflavum TaxID=2037914 RepID=UPI000C1A0C45|nr:tRNA (5-methylaminomethyl-2-thiouridine)(34)-methyltransferase MnmD [Pararhizobium haloflavum]